MNASLKKVIASKFTYISIAAVILLILMWIYRATIIWTLKTFALIAISLSLIYIVFCFAKESKKKADQKKSYGNVLKGTGAFAISTVAFVVLSWFGSVVLPAKINEGELIRIKTSLEVIGLADIVVTPTPDEGIVIAFNVGNVKSASNEAFTHSSAIFGTVSQIVKEGPVYCIAMNQGLPIAGIKGDLRIINESLKNPEKALKLTKHLEILTLEEMKKLW